MVNPSYQKQDIEKELESNMPNISATFRRTTQSPQQNLPQRNGRNKRTSFEEIHDSLNTKSTKADSRISEPDHS